MFGVGKNYSKWFFRILHMVPLAIIVFFVLGCSNNKPKRQPETVELGQQQGFVPEEGFVPNKKVALEIADAVLDQIYGEDIKDQRPFAVGLIGERWVIQGTYEDVPIDPKKDGVVTHGLVHIEIDRKTGQILKVSHSR